MKVSKLLIIMILLLAAGLGFSVGVNFKMYQTSVELSQQVVELSAETVKLAQSARK